LESRSEEKWLFKRNFTLVSKISEIQILDIKGKDWSKFRKELGKWLKCGFQMLRVVLGDKKLTLYVLSKITYWMRNIQEKK